MLERFKYKLYEHKFYIILRARLKLSKSLFKKELAI